MIKVTNLYKYFGKLEVLKGINMQVKKGEVVVIIGASGSGKSTLLRCLNLLEVPQKGQVFIDGTAITDPSVDINRVRRQVGMVFQQFNLFPHMSALENVTLAPLKVKKEEHAAAEELAEQLLIKVGLADKIREYPRRLSGGQQ
jgi:ABC-type polar amino acid transport system ATPase subunit